MWNNSHWSYFDYNLTSGAQAVHVPVDEDATPAERAGAHDEDYQVIFHVGQFYPFWTGAAPKQLRDNPLAVQHAFVRVETFLREKAGGIPATNFLTSQQWDEPNVWPPLQHILMQGLLNTPPSFGEEDPSYVAVQNLALGLAQRYLDSTFCTWYATGGSTSEVPKLQGLDATAVGTMFEKYADNATNVAGGGDEYTVVEGFGWTNGVLIWAADTFGDRLQRPNCGVVEPANVHSKRDVKMGGKMAVELDRWDAKWTKRFGKRARLD